MRSDAARTLPLPTMPLRSIPEADPQPEPLLVDAPTAAKMLAVSERTLRRLTTGGEIGVVRIGRRTLYSVEALRKWVRGRSG